MLWNKTQLAIGNVFATQKYNHKLIPILIIFISIIWFIMIIGIFNII
jgi:hypothetical protein